MAQNVQPALFTTVDLSPYCNAMPVEIARRWHPAAEQRVAGQESGTQRYWGVPFSLAASWLVLGADGRPAGSVTIPLAPPPSERAPSYLVFLHVCGAPATGSAEADYPPVLARQGERVADYVLVYADGSEHRQPIRWRFEINSVTPPWGQRAFAARPQTMDAPVDLRGPYARNAWGRSQTSVGSTGGPARYWLYALANPHPERALQAVRLEGSGTADVAVAALTLFFGQEHPLRHRPLRTFRITGAPTEAATSERSVPSPALDRLPALAIDLGIIARQYAVPAFDPDSWLRGEGIDTPLAEQGAAEPARALFADITASADATLTIGEHAVPLREAYKRGSAEAAGGTVRVEIVDPQRAWVHVTVEDGATGRPVPSRVHFRDRHGRYLPPYGHRHEVNDNWFEDYGADLKLHGTSYAYVDGTFQVELPVGEVYVELFKGFEHRPLRRQLRIAPGQRSLKLAVDRPLDWRSRGWVTADTHVHFISPETAWLQGQAEGLNLINLLASQWGDLYTNVGDLSGALSGVSRRGSVDETLIWVGTENRQHLLGHMSLLGIKGEPVFPMTTAGPDESYLGDPVWTTLAEWADEARRKDGVVVIPHFPSPYCEVAADIVLGKIDAVEINMAQWAVQLREWYRYLNCGYRVAAVGGTDKMSAGMPVGAIRTYALLDAGVPFSFEAWSAAVRAGRTFTTTGPLVDLHVEGHRPGDELALPAGGGRLHVEAIAESVVPFHALEVVVNGEVVAAREAEQGMYRAAIDEPVTIPGSAWIAARCISRMNRWVGSPRLVAAHTSPVYVIAGGEELFSPSDATYMLTLLEGGLTWLDTLATPPDPERQARNRRVFEDARAHLHERLHRHGHAHQHG